MPTIGRLFYEIGGNTDRLQAGRRNQELAPLLLNAKENLFDLAKQLEDTGAGMQSAALASMQMRIKEDADAAAEASGKQEEAGRIAADAAGLARMKEEELYNERLKLLSQGKENVDLLLKLQEAQEKFNAAIEKGLSHREKEKALNAVLGIREEIKAREDAARAYEKAFDAVQKLERERYEEAEKLRRKEAEEERKRFEDQAAFHAKLQAEISKASAEIAKIKPKDPLRDLIPRAPRRPRPN